MLTNKELNNVTNLLKGYYMGEVIPTASAIRGYYDREMWECGNHCMMYTDHSCIECYVEYVGKMPYCGEDMLAAHITCYVEGGHFCKSIEYWDARDVEKFSNVIELRI